MINMNNMQKKLLMYTQEGKSCRAIAKLVGANRNEVKRSSQGQRKQQKNFSSPNVCSGM